MKHSLLRKNLRAPSGAAQNLRAPSGAAQPASDPSDPFAIPGAEAPTLNLQPTTFNSRPQAAKGGGSRSTAAPGGSPLSSGNAATLAKPDGRHFRDASASTLAERPKGATLPRFTRATTLLIDNDVTRWHLAHGWIWNVSSSDNSPLGVFYCTLLCGDGCIIHFDALPHIPWSVILPAFRKAIRMISPVSDVVYATVPDSRAKLIRILIRLNFTPISSGGFLRDQTTPVTLLKLIK